MPLIDPATANLARSIGALVVAVILVLVVREDLPKWSIAAVVLAGAALEGLLVILRVITHTTEGKEGRILLSMSLVLLACALLTRPPAPLLIAMLIAVPATALGGAAMLLHRRRELQRR